jgi:nicotinate-nucleotide--dimethylbenzimidazole phosphoribosyltransferase
VTSTYEDQLAVVVGSIGAVDRNAEDDAWERLDSLTKPPRSLGRLEELAARIAAVQGTDHPSVAHKAIVLAAADHGVALRGVSPYPQDVTWQMVANFSAGGAAINQIAESVDAELVLVDVGVARDLSDLPDVRHEKVAWGTEDLSVGPAMSREQCARAMLVGVRLARELVERGFTLVGTGEMGIGNSTSAAALTAALTGARPEDVVGRGTGLDDAGVRRKAEIVRDSLVVNEELLGDPLGTLAALGGFELACLAGVVLGCAEERTCVVSDGYISGAAALAAVRLCPNASDVLFASHRSAEPGHGVVLGALELDPVLDLDMRLGEGTGAALAMGIMDAATRMISGMATFSEAGVAESSGTEATP